MAGIFLHTFQPPPVLARVGPFTIHWYGLFLSLGALAGYVVWLRLGRAYRLKSVQLETLFFLTVLAGFVGARLYHVLNEWPYYAARPTEILAIWNGGLAIHGALLAGLAVFMVYARRAKLSFPLLADIVVPAVALGQAIGRWGNYFNQELFGRPTALPWGIPIEIVKRPPELVTSEFFHPTFLYESIGSLLVFVILIFLHRRRLAGPEPRGRVSYGIIALIYFIAESLVRTVTELLRVDQVPLVAGVRLPLLVSILIALLAAVILVRRMKGVRA
ncbi:MAG: prolipoprotein diacylglyceryl transferase [Candidatus Kerfeldbacteria bacterium]|nr:prolipoprotein diacylglyceryl transferase [Candidatus Kerfeldbacteria bacterium]